MLEDGQIEMRGVISCNECHEHHPSPQDIFYTLPPSTGFTLLATVVSAALTRSSVGNQNSCHQVKAGVKVINQS